jgi:hypothetical protein
LHVHFGGTWSRADGKGMTIVHVILKERARADRQLRTQLERLLVALGMRRMNHQRFELLGIMTGEIDEAKVAQIEGNEAVEAVQRERARRLPNSARGGA